MTLRRILLALLLLVSAVSCAHVNDPSTPLRIHDRVALMTSEETAGLEAQLDLFFRQFGIDAQALFEAFPAEANLNTVAVERFKRLAVGADAPDQRGILFVYDTTAERLRIEISYALEGQLPDALVGYLIDDHARYLFDAGEPAHAFSLAIRLLTDRLRSAQLGGAFDPQAIAMLRRARYPAGGAGATGASPLGRESLTAFPAPDANSPQASFAPGQDVETTYRRFLAWLGRGVFEADSALFTPDSRAYLAEWPMTPAYLDRIFVVEYAQRFEIVEAGDHAILYSVSDPFIAPYLFQRTAEGWQIDLTAGRNNVAGIAGGRFSWTFRDATSPFLTPFQDRLVAIDGLLRIRGGDNRPGLPFAG